MPAAYPRDEISKTAWISRGFEVLAADVLAHPNDTHFDVLVIGSGYGGAIAAATFAKASKGTQPVRVGVLERGKEYLPGSFPVGLRELPRYVRQDSNKEGLFDIRLSPEVNTVVANGLGGGSLINAGVMEIPLASVFTNGWPAALQNAAERDPYYAETRALLGAFHDAKSNTIERQLPVPLPPKTQALKALAPPGKFRFAEITVAMTATASSGNVALEKCTRCGDCATGCNFGAKNSLDVNLLVRAHESGAEIYSGATVLELVKEAAGTWLVRCVHTNAKIRAREETVKDRVTEIRAANVVLAAGALGSTEILMRSRTKLSLSPRLGQRCSTNGDMLIVDYATSAPVHTVADEAVQPSMRNVGPTITGVVDLRETPSKVLIEEMSVPGGLRRVFTEVFATVNTLHALNEKDSEKHDQGFPDDDIYCVPEHRIENSALYAVMGDDGAAGTIELVDGAKLTIHDDGVARMRWPANGAQKALPDLKLFEDQVKELSTLTEDADTKGRLIPNPVWNLLPTGMEWLLENKKGPLTTVHPLGGCAMADSWADGVVDDRGRVFASSTPGDFHAGLAVLDGAVIPTALGTNPALTIAAVTLRAARRLATGNWGYTLPAAAPTAPTAAALPRPEFRETDTAFDPAPTEVEVIERLAGPVRFKTPGKNAVTRIVELTLAFNPKAVRDLTAPPRPGQQSVLAINTSPTAPVKSRIRIYDEALWRAMEKRWTRADGYERELEAVALYSAPLAGTISVFQRQKTRARRRIARALGAYVLNRGLRDAYQALTGGDEGPGWWDRLKSGVALASRSGEIRALVYDLTIGVPDPGAVLSLSGTKILGYKRFTYGRRANPWRQLMEVELDEFPGLKRSADERILALDARYLVRIGVPLFRIAAQKDGATALAELGAFVGYFLRQLLGLHIWSFRAPDKEDPVRHPDLLPRKNQSGLPVAQQFPIPLPPQKPDGGGSEFEGEVTITRFAQTNPDPAKRPLLMLHGYSASGTTFAHHALPDNFARYFHQRGWDVWIAELRTSPAHELKANQKKLSAEHHWSFEQLARVDLPAVLDRIQNDTIENGTKKKIDVIAHCMGTVVFSMAMLEETTPPNELHEKVERVAFTQVGPLVVFSPANIFRAYALRYFIDFLPESYRFRPKGEPTLADDLWDRLLATLPYPAEEFDIENPIAPWKNTSWTRTRHRMDALYGRDFNLVNIEDYVLDHIDDHFGALSLRTVAQTLHFVRYSLITTYQGENNFVSRANLRDRWPFPTLSLHGADNGLAHPSTVDRMRLVFADAGRRYLPPLLIADAGHQDALVGTKRHETCEAIKTFLTNPSIPAEGPVNEAMVAYPPWIGPIITEERPTPTAAPVLVVRLGAAPTHHKPEGVVMLRVSLDGDVIVRPDDPTQPWTLPYLLSHAAYYKSQALTDKRWDAFDAPLPHLMPGFPPAGQALLVLIVYSESPELDPGRLMGAYYRASTAPGAPTLEEFSPTMRAFGAPAGIKFSNFRLAVEATLAALVVQSPRALREPERDLRPLPARDRPGHPVLLAAHGLRDLELPIPVVKLPPKAGTAGLIFGTNTTQATTETIDTATGTALLGALDIDRGLMEGVIPYDSPPAPPPTPVAAGTTFALLSCQYPAGFLDGPIAYASYRRLLDRLEAAAGGAPRFAVLAGDQVYVDPTAGLYDPSAQDARYRVPYEYWLRQRNIRHTLRRIPSFMLLDDHEIDDNWEPLPPASEEHDENQERYDGGTAAYRKYQRGKSSSLGFDFRYDGFAFYVLDTRTTRSPRTVDTMEAAELFNGAALAALTGWLGKAGAGPKFIVSPAMLLPRLRRTAQHGGGLDDMNLGALHSDGWDGYPPTLAAVLGFIAEKGIQHVVFLSGDAHRGCVAVVELRDMANNLLARVHSIHTTAAYAPFPFANSLAEEFMAQEPISFTHLTASYTCVVNATLPAAPDGATMLRPWQDTLGAWKLDYEYAAGGVQTLTL